MRWNYRTWRTWKWSSTDYWCLLTHQRLNLTVVQINRMIQWFWNVSAPSLDFEIICSVLIKGNWTRSSGRSLRSGLGLLLLPFGEWTHSHFPNSGWWSTVQPTPQVFPKLSNPPFAPVFVIGPLPKLAPFFFLVVLFSNLQFYPEMADKWMCMCMCYHFIYLQ